MRKFERNFHEQHKMNSKTYSHKKFLDSQQMTIQIWSHCLLQSLRFKRLQNVGKFISLAHKSVEDDRTFFFTAVVSFSCNAVRRRCWHTYCNKISATLKRFEHNSVQLNNVSFNEILCQTVRNILRYYFRRTLTFTIFFTQKLDIKSCFLLSIFFPTEG